MALVAHVRIDKKQVEVGIYGDANPDDLKWIKQSLGVRGYLEFRILADASNPEDRAIIELAKRVPVGQKEVLQGAKKVAEWVTYDITVFGPPETEVISVVKRKAGDAPEALILMDAMNVTGEYLTSVTKTVDEIGGPAIAFSLNKQGAQRFEELTSQNKPNPATPDIYRKLGIILDKQLLSSPIIRTTISDHAMISGGSMKDREVASTVDVLRAGALPCRIRLVSEVRVERK